MDKNHEDHSKSIEKVVGKKIYSGYKQYLELSEEEREFKRKKANEEKQKIEEQSVNEVYLHYQISKQTGLRASDLDRFSWKQFNPETIPYSEFKKVRNWHPDKNMVGLFLNGPVGVGKSHMLKAIALDNYTADQSFYYISARNLKKDLRDYDKLEFNLRRYSNYDALLIDDLHVIKCKDHELETWWQLLEMRNEESKFTFFSSDKDPKEVETQFNTRIADRILLELSTMVKIPGKSFRKEIYKENLKIVKKNDLATQ